MKLFYTDLETTGLNPEEKFITEIATVYRNLITREEHVFHAYILPKEKPGDWDFLENLTGITWEFLESNGKDEHIVYQDYCKWLKKFIDP